VQDKAAIGPFGLVGEIVIVALGALGVAAMFQDYSYFHRPEVITPENIALKYGAVVVYAIVSTILNRKRRRSAEVKE
jgi:hypothetical protein